MLRIIRTIKDTYLINYLSRQNVIPKYGFPVDVVQLDVSHHGEQAKMLELDRDLRIALSEYAPDGKSVAAGKVWASRDIKRLPDRDWRRYRFAVCDHCQFYQRVLAGTLRSDVDPYPIKKRIRVSVRDDARGMRACL